MKSRTAEQKIDSLMAFYNDNPQSLVFSRLADIYRKEGNFSKAIEICINGLQNHPEYVTGRVVLGQCYYEQGNVQAALQEFLTVCSYDRRNQIAIKTLADLYSRQKMMDKAGDLYNLLHRMDPGNNSIRQLTKQFLPSGQTDLFTILGLPLPKSASNIQSAFQNQQQNDSFPGNDPYQEINNIQDSTSSIEEMAPSQISSNDLSNRMDILFGNDQQEELESQPVQENGFDSASENNDLDANITGDDISNRMDAMFGGDSANAENDSSSITEITGDDVQTKSNADAHRTSKNRQCGEMDTSVL
jgi:tetratricopeptide (TPR) repeat protein